MGSLINLLVSLVIGGICGCAAGYIMKSGQSLLFNIILGIVGGFVGGALFNLLGFSINGTLGSIISGIIGSCIVIFVVRLIKKK